MLILKLSKEQGNSSEPNDENLGLSTSFLYLGTKTACGYVKLSWNFNKTVNLIDWIGMFSIDQFNPLLYMDYKNYGVCGSKNGSVNWKIHASQIPINYDNNNSNNQVNLNLESNDNKFDNNNNRTTLCFRYFDGLTGAIRATSPPLLVYSNAQIAITSIVCKQLPKLKNSLFYTKICCSGTEMLNYRTSYSSDAYWQGLNFTFPVDCSGELKFTIKEKHWSGNLTIGVVNIPIIDLAEKTNQDLAFVLRSPFPSTNTKSSLITNNKASNKISAYNNSHCQIVVSCRLIPQLRQSYNETINSLLSQQQQYKDHEFLSDSLYQQENYLQQEKLSNNSLKNFAKNETQKQLQQISNTISQNKKNSINTNSSLIQNDKDSLKKNIDKQNNVSTYSCDEKLNLNESFNSLNLLTSTSKISGFSQSSITDSMCSILPSCSNLRSQNSKDDSNNLSDLHETQINKVNLSTELLALNSLVSISNLPPGWEVRVDRHGRLIYLDHINKRTTWYPPAILENQVVQNEKKYVCARRTVFNINNNEPNKKDKTNEFFTEKEKIIKFLQRQDFLHLMQSSYPEALKKYNESVYLKHIIHRIRRDSAKFALFERNRELVEFLNTFADKTQPLPSGWQTARHCGNKEQRLFIDHKTKRITLIDPRLPIEPTQRQRSGSAPPARRIKNNRETFSGSDIVNRADEIQVLVRERFPEIASKVCHKLQLISKMGEVALLKFANDIDLITAISVLDQTTRQPTSEFEEKLDYFYASLQKSGYGQGPAKIHFRLRRSHLTSDAFDKILICDNTLLRKSQIAVTFDEEDGLDYGGPSRELFFLLSRDLFNPYYGLFEYSANDTYTVQINPISKFIDNYLQWMELCGRVLGLALIHRCMIDTFFTRAFYKFLLGIPYIINDLQSMDSQFYNSLLWVRENKITPDLDLTFSVTEEVGGEIIEKELLTDGKNFLVNDSNKEYYISLILKWRMERSVEQQGKAILRGLYSIIDRDYLRIFDSEQLELVLSGTIEIDIEDWRENTEYKSDYYDGHVVINWFWQSVYSFSNADRLKLLQFVTGTSSVPYEGFKALRGSNGPKKFTIEKWGSEDSLPRAHTCFNRLDLPSYTTQKILFAKLKIAIYESSCYTIE